ncbi:helix-turn-helix domain-containing protein [Streptosporangium sp. NPDC001559]|uniref:helix-turn-helix domain-containing protein n=1 Tax=Streptosporangium sp. NPDC001559 TaxID=3366187 RepID=UPI0036EB0DF9
MPGLPFNTAAADARESVLTVLGSWSGLVAEQRGVTPPSRAVGDLARFLRRHVTWLTGHEAAAEITREMARLVNTARAVAHPSERRRVRVGECVEAGCPGELIVSVLPQQAHPAGGEIVCSSDETHRWQTHEWTRLSHRMGGNSGAGRATRWLSAAEVARLWRVPAGSVYRLASEHRWHRRSQSGRVRYDSTDVERTFAERGDR